METSQGWKWQHLSCQMPHRVDEKRAGQMSWPQSRLQQFSFIAVPLRAVNVWFLISVLTPLHHLLFVIALSDVNQDLINNTIWFSFYSFFINFYVRVALSYNKYIAARAIIILKYILKPVFLDLRSNIIIFFVFFRSMPLVPLKCVTESWEGSLKYRVRNTDLFLATFADWKSLCFFRILLTGSEVKVWQKSTKHGFHRVLSMVSNVTYHFLNSLSGNFF